MSGEDVQITLVSSVSFHHFPFTVSVPTLKMSLYFEISSLRTDSGRVKTSQLRKITLETSGEDVQTTLEMSGKDCTLFPLGQL